MAAPLLGYSSVLIDRYENELSKPEIRRDDSPEITFRKAYGLKTTPYQHKPKAAVFKPPMRGYSSPVIQPPRNHRIENDFNKLSSSGLETYEKGHSDYYENSDSDESGGYMEIVGQNNVNGRQCEAEEEEEEEERIVNSSQQRVTASEAQTDRNDLEKIVKEKDEAVCKLEGQVKAATDQLEQAELEKLKLQREIAKKEEELKTNQASQEKDVKNEIQKLQKEIEEKKGNEQTLKQELLKKEKALKDIKENSETIQKEYQKANKDATEAKQEVERLKKEKNAGAETNLQEAMKDMSALHEELTKKEELLVAKEEERENLKQQLDRSTDENEELSKSKETTQAQIQNLEKTTDEKEQEISDLNNQLLQLKNEENQKNQEFEDLKAAVTSKDDEIKHLREEQDALNTQIQTLNEEKQAKEYEREELKARLGQIQEENDDLKARLAYHERKRIVDLYWDKGSGEFGESHETFLSKVTEYLDQESVSLQLHSLAEKGPESQDDATVAICLNTSRLGTDVQAALDKLDVKGKSKKCMVIIFHHRRPQEGNNITPSDGVLDSPIKTQYGIKFVGDCLFWGTEGFYECEQNTEIVTALGNYLKKKYSK